MAARKGVWEEVDVSGDDDFVGGGEESVGFLVCLESEEYCWGAAGVSFLGSGEEVEFVYCLAAEGVEVVGTWWVGR